MPSQIEKESKERKSFLLHFYKQIKDETNYKTRHKPHQNALHDIKHKSWPKRGHKINNVCSRVSNVTDLSLLSRWCLMMS